MKLSFTTLGCPEWSLDQIIDRASEYGFDAVDFRGLNGEMNIYKLPEFTDRRQETVASLRDAGLEVSCFSSSVQVFPERSLEANLEEIRQYARLCQEFGTRYIRVFGGKIGDTPREEAIRMAVRHFRQMADIAREYDVKLLLETHDDWTACQYVRAVMEQVDSPSVGVLWDVHHPYRTIGEQPEDTWEALGPWIEYTHVKDSFVTGSDPLRFRYCLAGEGDIPLREICTLLRSKGYQGFYTLEWEKKWHPELEEAETVFPHYVQFMRSLEEAGQ